jgi:hypothetical protein
MNIQEKRRRRRKKMFEPLGIVLAGGFSSTILTTIRYPTEIIKTSLVLANKLGISSITTMTAISASLFNSREKLENLSHQHTALKLSPSELQRIQLLKVFQHRISLHSYLSLLMKSFPAAGIGFLAYEYVIKRLAEELDINTEDEQ